jgi:hypothetical protein
MKRSDLHIDRFIKESLARLEIKSIDHVWQKLYNRYSGLAEKQRKIDNNFKDSLENVETNFNPDSVWNGLLSSVKTRKKRKTRLLGFTILLFTIISCLGIFYLIKQNREPATNNGSTGNQIMKSKGDSKLSDINTVNDKKIFNKKNYNEKAVKQQTGAIQIVKTEDDNQQSGINTVKGKGIINKKNNNEKALNQQTAANQKLVDAGGEISKNGKTDNFDSRENINTQQLSGHLKETKVISVKPIKETNDTQKKTPPVLLVTDAISVKPTIEYKDTQKITPLVLLFSDSITKPTDSTNQFKQLKPKKRNTGLKVGVTFCPAYNLNSTSVNSSKSDMVHKNYNQLSNESVKPDFGYSFGLILGYGFLNLNLKSQVAYTTINLNGDYNYKNENIPIIDSATGKIISYIYKPDSNGVVMKSGITYNYLEIPLTLGYEYRLNNKWGIRADIGIYYLLQLQSKGSLIDYSNLQLTSSGNDGKYPMRKSSYGWSLGLGLVYKSKFLDYSVEPVYKKTLSSLYTNDLPVSDYITTIGLNISVTAKLKDIKSIFGIGKVNN